MAEIKNDPTADTVTDTAGISADELRRKRDADRKAKQRAAQRDPEAAHVGQKPGGQPKAEDPRKPVGNPFAGIRNAWTKKVGDPVGPVEAKRQLHGIHVGIAKLLRSRVQFRVDEFEEAGNAYEEVANHFFPPLRLILRIGAPLLLLGALVQIWARMIDETPWWQAWKERRQAPPEPSWEPAIPKDPISHQQAYEHTSPAYEHTSPADLNQEQAAVTVAPPPLPRRTLRR